MTQPAPPAAAPTDPTRPDAATAGTGTPGAEVEQPGATGDIVVALAVPQDVADALPQGTEEPDPDDTDGQPDPDDAPAVPLITLPKPDTIDSPSFLIAVLTAVRDAAAAAAAITGQVSGIGRAADPDGTGDEWFALVDAPAIDVFRAALITTLGQQTAPDGTPIATPEHGYVPRIVLGDLAPDADLPQQRLDAIPVTFGTVLVTQDEASVPVPLGPPAANPTQPNPQNQPVANGDVATQPGQLAPDSTAPAATKGKFGKGGPPISRGSWVVVGSQSGRVDLVVTNGKVPGVDADVEGSASDPAIRVVVYEESDGKWRSTGDKIASRVSKAKRTAPLSNRSTGKKDAGYAALVGLQAEHEVRVEADGLDTTAIPTGGAIKAVFERGVASWPGFERTVLDANTWGVERVKAFLGTCAGARPDGYVRDDDLLPAGHPERKALDGDAAPAAPTGDTVQVDADEVKGLLASLRGE